MTPAREAFVNMTSSLRALYRRLRVVWHPEVFRYHLLHSSASRFEGCYLKIVDAEERQPYALMVGIILGHNRHAFIQVLDGRTGRSSYHRFGIDQFSADPRRLDIRIGDNHFHRGGFTLALDRAGEGARHVLQGTLHFGETRGWPSSVISPGTMGPYSFVPFIPCRHHFISLNHSLAGALKTDDGELRYDGGRGYLEKTWGSSFPDAYTWVQSNHFDQEEVAVVAALAIVPWARIQFRSFLATILYQGRIYCFRSHLGSVLEELREESDTLKLTVRNRDHRLELTARKVGPPSNLKAPYGGEMTERVAESMLSTVDVRLSSVEGAEIFSGTGRNACLEIQGKLETVDVKRRTAIPLATVPIQRLLLRGVDRLIVK